MCCGGFLLLLVLSLILSFSGSSFDIVQYCGQPGDYIIRPPQSDLYYKEYQEFCEKITTFEVSLNNEKDISIVSDNQDNLESTKKLCFATDFIRGFLVKVYEISDWMDHMEAGSFNSIIY